VARRRMRGFARRRGPERERTPSAAQLAAARVRYRAELIAGGPKALIEFAGSEEADVIVVGRRGRGGFAELVLGSLSHHLVHHSHTPVIVVPSAQD
jgi:nucleotide-binding universal stress UspA family protein